MASNVPAVYSDEGDVPTNGKDTAAWQELREISDRWAKWHDDFGGDLHDKEKNFARIIDDYFDLLSESLGGPL